MGVFGIKMFIRKWDLWICLLRNPATTLETPWNFPLKREKRNINLLSSLYKRGTVRGVPTGHRINYLLCAKSCAKGFRYMSFTIMNRRLSLLLTPFYRCINWGIRRLGLVTEMGRIRYWTWACVYLAPHCQHLFGTSPQGNSGKTDCDSLWQVRKLFRPQGLIWRGSQGQEVG